MPTADSKVLRKLGHNERYQLAMYMLDQYRGTSITCRYNVPRYLAGPAAKPQLVQIVESAIANAVLTHPILQVGILNAESKKPAWVRLDVLDLQEHITWHFSATSTKEEFDAETQDLAASEVDGLYPNLPSQPGWRFLILRQEATDLLDMMFTWNHPHADGWSGKIFQTTLRDTLRNISIQPVQGGEIREGRILKLPEKDPRLPPPIEDICKLPLSLKYALKILWEELGPASLSWKRSSLARWAPVQLAPYKTQVRSFTIGPEDRDKILSACRQRKTTLTGLLHAVTLASLALRIGTAATAFESGTTVNLRRFMPADPPRYPGFQPEETMSNYVTLMSHVFDEPAVKSIRSFPVAGGEALSGDLLKKLWLIAAKVRRDIESKLELGLKNDPVGLMKFVPDWRQQLTDAAKRPRQHSWWITGLGILDAIPQPGATPASAQTINCETGCNGSSLENDGWKLRRAQFTLSSETPAGALMISPMSVAGPEGCLCVAVSWQDCAVDFSKGERLVADLKRWLIQIATEG